MQADTERERRESAEKTYVYVGLSGVDAELM